MKHSIQTYIWLVTCSVVLLSACDWEAANETTLLVNIGEKNHNAEERLATRSSVSSTYPSLSTILINVETETLTTQDINFQYNNGLLTLNTAQTDIVITDTDVSFNVPTDEIITLSITAYNQSGYRIYSGVTDISPEDLTKAVVEVDVPIRIDIDESITVRYDSSSPNPCADDDYDLFCNEFEDLFLNAAGEPDIDSDGDVNSDDTDADGDLLIDQKDNNIYSIDDETNITVSNHGYPMFMVANREPFIDDINIVADYSQMGSGNEGGYLLPLTLPASSDVDVDVNDAIEYNVKDGQDFSVNSIADVYIEDDTKLVFWDYTGGITTELSIDIEARDLVNRSLQFDNSPILPVEFTVNVTFVGVPVVDVIDSGTGLTLDLPLVDLTLSLP